MEEPRLSVPIPRQHGDPSATAAANGNGGARAQSRYKKRRRDDNEEEDYTHHRRRRHYDDDDGGEFRVTRAGVAWFSGIGAVLGTALSLIGSVTLVVPWMLHPIERDIVSLDERIDDLEAFENRVPVTVRGVVDRALVPFANNHNRIDGELQVLRDTKVNNRLREEMVKRYDNHLDQLARRLLVLENNQMRRTSTPR